MTDSKQLWAKFQKYYREFPAIELGMDISRMNFDEAFIEFIRPKMAKAISDMAAIDSGAVANTDEKRMVGHYWLRNPALAPSREIRSQIEQTVADIRRFAAEVHSGKVSANGQPFRNLLLVGIGGSALGPQFVSNALSQPGKDKMQIFFLDNTDPDGMDRVFAMLAGKLDETLCVVISKSGGTKETRNGMVETEEAFRRAGLVFERHAVAITSQGSELDKLASSKGWIARFPMWDWVGGRTSELSAVGLLPAALQGFDIDSMLAGAKACDEANRNPDFLSNPAAILSAMWYCAGNGKGTKNMVVLPYKDRLELFSKYLQQLIMESIGKAMDCNGNVVNQGITVFGNKGATDQHSYIQQLREGPNDFFGTFIVAGVDRTTTTLQVEPNVTSGDYLTGFFLGTRQALYENGRESLTITIKQISPFAVGMLIALFERAVGLYASLVNINAYHQPGVEAGKKAAAVVLNLQTRIIAALCSHSGQAKTIAEISELVGGSENSETVFWICSHLAANGRLRASGGSLTERTFAYTS